MTENSKATAVHAQQPSASNQGAHVGATPTQAPQSHQPPATAPAHASAPPAAPKPARKGVLTNGMSISKGPDNAVQLVLPGSPSFDFDPETGEPNLNGETVLAEGDRHGIRVVVTSGGRKIHCCTLDEYEAAIGTLPSPRAVYEHFFPQAK